MTGTHHSRQWSSPSGHDASHPSSGEMREAAPGMVLQATQHPCALALGVDLSICEIAHLPPWAHGAADLGELVAVEFDLVVLAAPGPQLRVTPGTLRKVRPHA
eukprot:CAMPEP_0179326328 /NCGR_PEP_ID=MMETSP0797-20121207/61370_1 /TAXON_ID=47934 /ORGANISM="Dinophysis acuminata, Strain DAEP01" /LENGTH=102 /DNA_ID=CAMNT_0021038579 /DNA_START=946 /DNA_END=1256 /DNA_ORIENTATION=+